MDTKTARPIPKSHPIHPAPRGVALDQAIHSLLIVQMAAGSRIAATETTQTIARTARNTLLTAYTPWIIDLATLGRHGLQGSDDRAGQALLACVEVIGNYDPTTNVPLHSYLRANAALEGEAVAGAEMPADHLNQKQHRHAAKEDITLVRSKSSRRPISNDGLTFADLLPGEHYWPAEEAPDDEKRTAVANELKRISKFHRALLVDRWGLAGGMPRSLKDLAASRGITVRAARKALNQAEKALAATAPNLHEYLNRADEEGQAAA